MEFQPDVMVGSHIRLVRKLGEGGMGSVWVAEHLTLHTQVAVKFVSVGFAHDESVIERFRREAMTVAKLKNPHVVQVFDHGVTAEGSPYMVMELLEGEDLGNAIGRLGTLPVPDVVRVVHQACKALGKAHALALVHRDIKPENLFLTDLDGEIFLKVLDFGIAKDTGAQARGMTTTGSMVGTPYYMSPEQVLSAKLVSSGADLWSLAVVAYHALTGRVPFDGETVAGVFIAIERAVFDLPSVHRPGLMPSMDAWFMRALARDPTARFPTAKEFATSFENAALGRAWQEDTETPAVPVPPMVASPAGTGQVAAPAIGTSVQPVAIEPAIQAVTAPSEAVPRVSATLAGTAGTARARVERGRSSKLVLVGLGGLGALGLAVGLVVLMVLSGGTQPTSTEPDLESSTIRAGASASSEAGVEEAGEALEVEDLPKATSEPTGVRPRALAQPVASTSKPRGKNKPVETSTIVPPPAPPAPPAPPTKERKEYGF